MKNLLNKKVTWKNKKNRDWLSKKSKGKIVIDWGNIVRVCWDDNTCTETQLSFLKIED